MTKIKTMIPNALTIIGLSTGFSAIWFALEKQWESAIIATFIAGIFDLLDGFAAKKLDAASALGVQLDSFSDLICFGVSPAIVIYLWSNHPVLPWGWLATVLFCVAAVIRLARFNIASEQANADPEWRRGFFVGIPMPAAAGLCYFPMLLSFLLPQVTWLASPQVNTMTLIIVAILMISHLPTMGFKKAPVSKLGKGLLFFCVGSVFLLFPFNPWIAFILMGTYYLISLPLASLLYFRHPKGSIK